MEEIERDEGGMESREERLLKRSAAAVEEDEEAAGAGEKPSAKRQNTGAEAGGAARAQAGAPAGAGAADGEAGPGAAPAPAGGGAGAMENGGAAGADRPAVPASASGAGASASQPPAAVPAVQNVRGAYAQREEFLLGLETSGEVVFQGIRNDGKLDTLKMLLAAKNIYSKQLPNMPREYIVKLVFDPTHRTIIVRKPSSHANNVKANGAGAPSSSSAPAGAREDINCPNSNVVGGITYRSFTGGGRRFGEIAFCAVLASQQVRGYGTRLMNHAKEYAKCEEGGGLTHFLTYADNAAVGYFAKQGFTKEISLDKELWHGYIKDYDGGTLMECILRHELDYTGFPTVIRRQRGALDKVVRTLSNAHVVRPGIFDAAGRRAYEGSDPMRIPGAEQAGYKRQAPAYGLLIARSGSGGKKLLPAGEPPTEHNLQRFMLQVLETMRQHDCSWPFVEKVPIAEVPDYYDVVKDPIDLGAIEDKVTAGGYYVTLEIFAADFKRMFNNCRTYNSPDTIYFKCANKLEEIFENCIRSGIQKY